MNEEEKKTAEERAAQALISNTEDIAEAAPAAEKGGKSAKQKTDGENKVFRKFKIKDIVFLAIITACTLVTGAIMPLLVHVPVFGIIQLGLGIQFSLFPVIGMMKVRKPGALLLMALFISVFLVFMFAPMVLISVCGLVAEALVLLIFRGYKSDWACVFAGTVYMPLTVPLLYMYYNINYTVTGAENEAVSMFIGGTDPWVIVGMTVAVVAVCFVGSLIGMLIARELRKAGVLKK